MSLATRLSHSDSTVIVKACSNAYHHPDHSSEHSPDAFLFLLNMSKDIKTPNTCTSLYPAGGTAKPTLRRKIATASLEAATAPLPTVPFLTASQVCLSAGEHTITHHISTQLRTLAELPGIWAHLCTQHGWSAPAIFYPVYWPPVPCGHFRHVFPQTAF
jgi:hypothetical protein